MTPRKSRRHLISTGGVLFALLFCCMTVTVADERTVGNSFPGSPLYPESAVMRLDAASDFRDDRNVRCTLIDDAGRYAYLGTWGSPARIIKMDLGEDTADLPVQVATLVLEGGEQNISCGMIDSDAGFAWFGTESNPARIIKVSLGEGTDPPKLIASVTLPAADRQLRCAAHDKAANMGYFGVNTSPAVVIKVALGEGINPPAKVGDTELPTNGQQLNCSLFDPVRRFAYFSEAASGKLFKIAPGSAGAPPILAGEMSGMPQVRCAVIDPESGHAWFGTNTSPGKVYKVDVSSGSSSPHLLGSITLDSRDENLAAAVIDAPGGFAYFSGEESGIYGAVIKVSLGKNGAPFERIHRQQLYTDEKVLNSGIINVSRGFAWFSSQTAPSRIVKVGLSPQSHITRLGCTELESGEIKTNAAVMDSQAEYAWIGTETSPGRIIKTALYRGEKRPHRLNRIDLAADENTILCGAIDEERGYGWFGTYDGNPGRVVMVSLGEGDAPPERHGALTLNANESGLRCVALDASREYAFFGTHSQPPRIIKVALGSGSTLPQRAASISFGTLEDAFRCVAYDAVHNLLYFGSDRGYILRVAPGSGNAPPQILDTIQLSSPQSSLVSAVLDPQAGYAWFGTMDNPGRVVKVDIHPQRSFARISTLTLSAGESALFAAARDPQTNYGYFGTNTPPGKVIAVDLGSGSAQPARLGSVTLKEGEGYLRTALLHPNGSRLWFTCNSVPGNLVRLGVGHAEFIKGTRLTLSEPAAVTKIHFYSHRAKGAVRLAIYQYGASPALLWESDAIPNTVQNGWLTVPIALGTPSALALPAGVYWLAYQVNCPDPVPSWSGGAAGSGFSVVHPFGSFPENLFQNTPTAIQPTSDNWSMYLSYDNHLDAPSDPDSAEITESSIRWIWKDNTANESGFKVWADPGNAIPVTQRETLPADSTSWLWDGLTPNCLYSFQTAAFLFADSEKTQAISRRTKAAAALPGTSILCDHPLDTPFPAGTLFTFTNPAGFGEGIHGDSPDKISAYRYVWNSTADHVFKGTETLWNSGNLIQIPPALSKQYYLHLLSLNEAGEPGGVLHYGPFVIDAEPPQAPSVSGPLLTGNPRPQWSWLSGGGGAGIYEVELNGSGTWTETTNLFYVPDHDLPEGAHTLRVRERDEAGNWSVPGLFTITVDLSALGAAILPLNPPETSASLLSFQIRFSRDVGSSFTLSALSVTGTLTGDLTLTGEGADYLVTLLLDDPEAEGDAGIRISGGMIADGLGNYYHGGVSPLLHIIKWREPYFTETPLGGRKYEGDTHLLRTIPNCTASSLVYKWKCERGDKSIVTGPATSEWLFEPLSLADAGQYWCEVTYDGITRTAEPVLLEVKAPLTITKAPRGASVEAGDSHRFIISVTGGYAPLSYVWYKDGVVLPGDQGDSSLLLTALVPEDSGEYTVSVSDSNGSTVTAPAVLLEIYETTVPLSGAAGTALILLVLFFFVRHRFLSPERRTSADASE